MGLKGMTIILIDNIKTGKTDAFNEDIYEPVEIEVNNVLVAPSSNDDIITATDLTGKKAVYSLAIPKQDTHIFKGKYVKFFGKTWHVLGFEIEGMEENIPLKWNKKIMVETYE